jgi:hypothetical protein
MKFVLFKMLFVGSNAMFSPSPTLSFGALCSEIVCEASLFLQLPVYFSVAEIAVESVVPTVLGLPGRRMLSHRSAVGRVLSN